MQVGQIKHRVDFDAIVLETVTALVYAVNEAARKDFRKRCGGRIHAAIASLDGLALVRHLAGHSSKGPGVVIVTLGKEKGINWHSLLRRCTWKRKDWREEQMLLELHGRHGAVKINPPVWRDCADRAVSAVSPAKSEPRTVLRHHLQWSAAYATPNPPSRDELFSYKDELGSLPVPTGDDQQYIFANIPLFGSLVPWQVRSHK